MEMVDPTPPSGGQAAQELQVWRAWRRQQRRPRPPVFVAAVWSMHLCQSSQIQSGISRSAPTDGCLEYSMKLRHITPIFRPVLPP